MSVHMLRLGFNRVFGLFLIHIILYALLGGTKAFATAARQSIPKEFTLVELNELLLKKDSLLRNPAESIALLTTIKENLPAALADSTQWKLLETLGNLHFKLQQTELALAYYQQCVALEVAQKNNLYLFRSYFMLGTIHERLTHNYQQSKNYFKQALQIAQNRQDKNQTGMVYYQLGLIAYKENQYNSAKYFYETAAKSYALIEKKNKQASAIRAIGSICLQQQDYKAALHYFQRAFQLGKFEWTETEKAYWQLNIAYAYKGLGKLETAAQELWQLAPFYEQQKDTANLLRVYNYLASIYRDLNDYKTATELQYKRLNLQKKSHNNKGIIYTLLNLGSIAKAENDLTQATRFYQEALQEAFNQNDTLKIANTQRLIGSVYLEKNEYTKAESHLLKAFSLSQKLQDDENYRITAKLLTQLYLAMQKRSKASLYFKIVQSESSSNQSPTTLLHFHSLAVSYYAHRGDFTKMRAAQRAEQQLRDSLNSAQTNRQILELKEAYEAEKKDSKIEELEKQSVLQEKIVAQQNHIMLSLGVAMFLFLGLVVMFYQRFRLKAKAQARVELLMQDLHHRVKNNLQVVASLLQLYLQGIDDPQAQKTIQEGEDRIRAMGLLHQQLYESEDVAEIDMPIYVQRLVQHLQEIYGISNEDIAFQLAIPTLRLDVSKAIPLGLIINELLVNSIKYAFSETDKSIAVKPMVKICVEVNAKTLQLTIADNGIGLQNEAEQRYQNSFGLKLVRSMIRQLKGEVQFKTQEGFQCAISVKT